MVGLDTGFFIALMKKNKKTECMLFFYPRILCLLKQVIGC